MDCVFCKIVAGQIPAFKVFGDDGTLAFMDINPVSEGHVLVVPTLHFENLFDADDGALGRVMATARVVARAMRDTLAVDSLNLIQANGRWAVQSVPHFHLHLIPRRENDGVGFDWLQQPGDMAAIQQIGDRLSAALA